MKALNYSLPILTTQGGSDYDFNKFFLAGLLMAPKQNITFDYLSFFSFLNYIYRTHSANQKVNNTFSTSGKSNRELT